MKTEHFIKVLLLFLMMSLLTGCFPDNRVIYDGPLQVEFRPVTDAINLSEQSSYSANIQLIGPHQDHSINILYEIDTERSSAVRGVHFDMHSDTARIEPNSSFASIEMQIYPDSFDDQSLDLVITLSGDESGEVRAAQNYKTFTLTIHP